MFERWQLNWAYVGNSSEYQSNDRELTQQMDMHGRAKFNIPIFENALVFKDDKVNILLCSFAKVIYLHRKRNYLQIIF